MGGILVSADAANIVTTIQSVGFPIVMCLAMGWYVWDNNKAHREEIARLNDQHAEEMKSVTEAVHNNTVALEKLCTLMERAD